MTRIGLACLLGAAMVSGGCGDDERPMMGADAGPMTDGGADAGRDSGPTDAGFDAGPTGDGNDSFETAETLALGVDGAMGAIDPAGDHDFYTFEGTEGQWIAINTEANPEDDPEMVDTVVTLYDASMTRIAENDDSFPRVNTDSELITRLPADGTYYIEVQEWSTWAEETAEGDPSFEYTLTVLEVEAEAAAVTIETEAGDDETTAQALGFSMDFQFLLGTFEDMTDVDVFSFTVGGTVPRSFQATLMPTGDTGYGSTSPAVVWVTDSTGATIIARIDQAAMFDEITPSLEPGDYLLWVAHPEAAAGTNDFYVAKVLLGMENPAEAATVNDTLAVAEPLTLEMAASGTGRSAFVLAHLGTADVADYFSFDVMEMETVAVACGSASGGSGVQDLNVSIRADDDTVIMEATEMPPEGVFMDDVGITAAGTYYLRLTKGGQDAEVTGDWIRCGIHASPPAM